MWEFMSQYADSFWKAGEFSFEVFSVIMAWVITLGFAYFAFRIIAATGEMIADEIREHRERR